MLKGIPCYNLFKSRKFFGKEFVHQQRNKQSKEKNHKPAAHKHSIVDTLVL